MSLNLFSSAVAPLLNSNEDDLRSRRSPQKLLGGASSALSNKPSKSSSLHMGGSHHSRLALLGERPGSQSNIDYMGVIDQAEKLMERVGGFE